MTVHACACINTHTHTHTHTYTRTPSTHGHSHDRTCAARRAAGQRACLCQSTILLLLLPLQLRGKSFCGSFIFKFLGGHSQRAGHRFHLRLTKAWLSCGGRGLHRRTHDSYRSIFLFRCVYYTCAHRDRQTDRHTHTHAHTSDGVEVEAAACKL